MQNRRWNIFVRELEDMLKERGLRLGQLDDRVGIHREKVRRFKRATRLSGVKLTLRILPLRSVHVFTVKRRKRVRKSVATAIMQVLTS